MEKIFNGAKFKEIRKDRGMSQEELANRAETVICQVSRIELGKTKRPRDQSLDKFAEALECQVDDFFSPIKLDYVDELPAPMEMVEKDTLYPEEGKANVDVFTGHTPETILAMLPAIAERLDEESERSGRVQVIIISNTNIWFRLTMAPHSAQQLVRSVNSEGLLEVGILRGQVTCLGAGRDDWSCDHYIGPTIQAVVAERLGWDQEDVLPQDSLYYLGAGEDEAQAILLACANARNVSMGFFDSFERFLMGKYGMSAVDSWLMVPLCDLCEHIHQREEDDDSNLQQ